MKRSIIILALATILLSAFNACNSNSKADKATESKQKKGKYTCTMHPDVSADKPGVCPKCGMELVERDTTEDK
jgi:hypothetical protein